MGDGSAPEMVRTARSQFELSNQVVEKMQTAAPIALKEPLPQEGPSRWYVQEKKPKKYMSGRGKGGKGLGKYAFNI